jgi:hypothetical protein
VDKINEVLKRTDWVKLSHQKVTIQRTMRVLQRTLDAIGEALIGENDAMEQFCKARGGMALAKVVNAEFEEISVHLDDLLQWIEQIEKCAQAAGYPVVRMDAGISPISGLRAAQQSTEGHKKPGEPPRCLRGSLVLSHRRRPT